MRTSLKGITLIKQFESLRLRAYLCPAGVPTIGYGTTAEVTLADVRAGRTCTEVEADTLLRMSLFEIERNVHRLITAPTNQNQFDAFVSLVYNIGVSAFAKSSVLKAHNRGDTFAAAKAFGLWNKARVGGALQPLKGLTRRRAAEAALYMEQADGDEGQIQYLMPQAVEPEKSMSGSTINRGAALAGGTAAATAAVDALRVVNDAKDQVSMLGAWLVPGLCLAVVALCGYIVWQRFNQRKRGEA